MSLHSLSDLRKQFGDIDKSILILLSIRSQLSKEIAKIKKKKSLDVAQPDVFKKQMKKRYSENKKFDLDPKFIDKIFNSIHQESIKIQKKEIKKS